MNTPANEPWIDRAVVLLEQSAQSLDAVTLVSLNRARQAALAQRRSVRHGWVIGGSVVGATLALVVGLGIGHRAQAPLAHVPVAAEQGTIDPATLTGDDPLDLYENLDFYVWLDAEQRDSNG